MYKEIDPIKARDLSATGRPVIRVTLMGESIGYKCCYGFETKVIKAASGPKDMCVYSLWLCSNMLCKEFDPIKAKDLSAVGHPVTRVTLVQECV